MKVVAAPSRFQHSADCPALLDLALLSLPSSSLAAHRLCRKVLIHRVEQARRLRPLHSVLVQPSLLPRPAAPMPSLPTSRALVLFASLAAFVNAAVTPTEPSSAKQVFTAGQKCSFRYDLDKTGVGVWPL